MKHFNVILLSVVMAMFITMLVPKLVENIDMSKRYVKNLVQYKQDGNYDKQVLIQIGHCKFDGFQNCNHDASVKNGGTHFGEYTEPGMTQYIAFQARDYLIASGLPSDQIDVIGASVSEIKAHSNISYRYFVSLHMDGSIRECATGASIGYPNKETKEFHVLWKKFYGELFPFKFMNDNFSGARMFHYYMWNKIDAGDEMLIEFGEMTCEKQINWLVKNRDSLGNMLGEYISTYSNYK